MSATTTPDNIVYWTTSPADPASIVTESATQATSIQEALNKRQNYDFRWADSAARLAQAGMAYGNQGFQIDTGAGYLFDGSVWKLWDKPVASFSPTISGTNIGSTGTNTASWSVSSGRVFVTGNITLGGTGISVGSTTVTYPVASITTVANTIIGQAGFRDTGSATYLGVVNHQTSTTGELLVPNVASTYPSQVNISSTIPFTWVATDYITYTYSFIPA